MNFTQGFLEGAFVALLTVLVLLIIALIFLARFGMKLTQREAQHRVLVETQLQALNAKTEAVIEQLRSQQKRDA